MSIVKPVIMNARKQYKRGTSLKWPPNICDQRIVTNF